MNYTMTTRMETTTTTVVDARGCNGPSSASSVSSRAFVQPEAGAASAFQQGEEDSSEEGASLLLMTRPSPERAAEACNSFQLKELQKRPPRGRECNSFQLKELQ